MSNQPTIHKAKLDADGTVKSATYSIVQEDGSVFNHPAVSGSAKAHEDLIAAFKKLDRHLAILAEQYNKTGKYDTQNVSCRAFSLNGDDDKESIVLTGVRGLSTKKVVILNSPLFKWNAENAADVYDDVDNLILDVNVAKQEVHEYLFNGKHAPEPVQKEMFEEESEQHKSED